ncbi:MAG: GYD domain-containing protein [Pirellulales bacterium]
MATFITTLRFTDKGIAGIKDTCKRSAAFNKASKKMNIKVLNVYWTLGTFDGVLIFEAPDDQTATAAMLGLGAGDNVHTSTVRAFNAAEMEKIVARL